MADRVHIRFVVEADRCDVVLITQADGEDISASTRVVLVPTAQGRITDDRRPVDAGIYLIKDGRSFWEPGEMLLVKNDPKYNEQWPRPLVPYKRVYGVDEPRNLPRLANDGKRAWLVIPVATALEPGPELVWDVSWR